MNVINIPGNQMIQQNQTNATSIETFTGNNYTNVNVPINQSNCVNAHTIQYNRQPNQLAAIPQFHQLNQNYQNQQLIVPMNQQQIVQNQMNQQTIYQYQNGNTNPYQSIYHQSQTPQQQFIFFYQK